MKAGNTGGYLLPYWKIICMIKISVVAYKTLLYQQNQIHQPPTSDSGATGLPPIGNAFMYKEARSNNFGEIVFVSCERTDIIQFTNITFYYNRYSF